MFIKEYKELLKAIWPMCRKNELYTEEMFIQDIIGKTKTLLSKHIGKENTDDIYHPALRAGSNQRLQDIKKRLKL